MENVPVDVHDAKTGAVETRDNWSAECTIKDGDALLWDERLTLPLYADLPTAMQAVQDFLKRAPSIITAQTKKKGSK
jgi:hypothetical protein